MKISVIYFRFRWRCEFIFFMGNNVTFSTGNQFGNSVQNKIVGFCG